jgi:hypothetical protein
MEARPPSDSSLRFMPMAGSERLTTLIGIALALAVLFTTAAGAVYWLGERGQRTPAAETAAVFEHAPPAFVPLFQWPAAASLTAACFVEPVLNDLSGLDNSAPIKDRRSQSVSGSPSPTQSCTGTFDATVPERSGSLRSPPDQAPQDQSGQTPAAAQSPTPVPSPQPKFAVGLAPITEPMLPYTPAPAAAAPPRPETLPAPIAPPKPRRNIPVASPSPSSGMVNF